MKQQALAAFAAFVGRDWADATHDLCLHAAGTERRELLVLAHRPEAIDAWVQTLRTRCNGPPVAVCLALQKGPLVSARRAYDVLVLLPIQPFPLAQDRAALTPSPAQDDPTDAEFQVERLLTHRDTRTPLAPPSPTMRVFAPRVEHRRRLVGDQVRRTNRLTRALQNSLPHVLQGFQEKETGSFGDFLRHWPTLTAAHHARRTTLEHCCQAHAVHSANVLQTRLEAIKSAVALTTDDGVITPNALLVHALVAPLRVTLHAMADFDTAIAHRAQEPPDCPLLDAFPGAGAVCAPRLRVACGAPRERDASAAELQK